VTITLLHTNDIHGHLTPWRGWEGELTGKTIGGLGRLAGAVAAVRQERGANLLLLDAGDLIGDTMIAGRTRGEALWRAVQILGYDVLAVGNHEPDFDWQTLREHGGGLPPYVAANLVEREGGTPVATPYVVKEVGGVKVGVLGLAYPNTPWTTPPKNVEGLEFRDPVSTVRHFLPMLRDDGVEVVVVLSHLGLGGDERLARAVAGIDVIVGGHSHNRMAKAERVGGTLIVQAGAHGSDLGRLDLTVEDGWITGHRRTLVLLDHEAIPTQEEAERLVEELLDPHRRALEEVVGEAGDWCA
jgi:5'-nucleotidase